MTARTWEELREEWFLGLPGGVSPTATVQGFASARAFLGDDWPEKFAQGRGFWDAVEIIDTGLALEALNGIPKFDRLLDKVPRDHTSAMCELMLLAALKHMGLDPEVEPTTDASVPDARARWFDGDWIYFEASRVDIAVAKRDLWAFMVSVANDLFSCFTQPYHVEIAMDEATPTSQAAVVAEVRSMLINNSKESHVPGVAHIFISDIDVHRLRDYLKTVGDNTPRMTSNTGRIVPSPSGPIRRQVTISLPASDERAAEILERERRQLSRGCRNVIVLDVARVGTVSRWKELIERRLQPTLNTRIGSVLLTFRFAGTEGVGTKVTTIENAYARRPIPGGFLRSFEKALVEWRRRFQ